MVTDYTLIVIIGIVVGCLALVTVVAIVSIALYKFERLKVEANATVNADLLNGNVSGDAHVNIDGESKKQK